MLKRYVTKKAKQLTKHRAPWVTTDQKPQRVTPLGVGNKRVFTVTRTKGVHKSTSARHPDNLTITGLEGAVPSGEPR